MGYLCGCYIYWYGNMCDLNNGTHLGASGAQRATEINGCNTMMQEIRVGQVKQTHLPFCAKSSKVHCCLGFNLGQSSKVVSLIVLIPFIKKKFDFM